MALIFWKQRDPWPPGARGEKGTFEIYGRRPNYRLKHLPPVWTLRGFIERGDYPQHRRTYDTGVFRVPQNETEDAAFQREFEQLNQPISLFVIGVCIEVGNCILYPQVAVHPEYREQGHMSRFLDGLPRDRTVVFVEVLPQSKMPMMLGRRGFHPWWAKDDTDEIGCWFPVYVREAQC